MRCYILDILTTFKGFSKSVGSLVTNRNKTTCYSEICLCTGTVYWGVMLPPSMLRAKGAAGFLQHASQKPAVKAQTPIFTIDAHTSGFPRPLLQI